MPLSSPPAFGFLFDLPAFRNLAPNVCPSPPMSACDDIIADLTFRPGVTQLPSGSAATSGDVFDKDAGLADEIVVVAQMLIEAREVSEPRFALLMCNRINEKHFVNTLVSFTGQDARIVLGALQMWLDSYLMDPSYNAILYRRGIYCLIKLSSVSGELPPSLFLSGIDIGTSRDPHYLGGFADIFQGRYKGMNVAVKRLRIYAANPAAIHRTFSREALVWRQLKHPHVLPFLGVDAETFRAVGHYCMVSPWLSKGSLLQQLQQDTIGSSRHRLLREVAEGLAYLHTLKVVHGDIHCGNIFIDDNGCARVADFGITVVGDETVGRLTTTANAAGAIRWMAPERLDPETCAGRLTPAGDVWSFACLCLMMYTRDQPFHYISSTFAVQLHVVSGKIPKRPSLEECYGSFLYDELWAFMVKCWNHKASQRPVMQAVVEHMRLLDQQTDHSHSGYPSHLPQAEAVEPDDTLSALSQPGHVSRYDHPPNTSAAPFILEDVATAPFAQPLLDVEKVIESPVSLGIAMKRRPRALSTGSLNRRTNENSSTQGSPDVIRSISVLIVEDNIINQKILSAFMRKHKIRYEVASNGEEAVNKWIMGSFQLILMDIQMPVMDGLLATKEIRRLEKMAGSAEHSPSYDKNIPFFEGLGTSKTPATPTGSSVTIIALTASSRQDVKIAALAAGCNDFLIKPLNHSWLRQKIVEWSSVKALQMCEEFHPEARRISGLQTARAQSVANNLHIPERRFARTRSLHILPGNALTSESSAVTRIVGEPHIPIQRNMTRDTELVTSLEHRSSNSTTTLLQSLVADAPAMSPKVNASSQSPRPAAGKFTPPVFIGNKSSIATPALAVINIAAVAYASKM